MESQQLAGMQAACRVWHAITRTQRQADVQHEGFLGKLWPDGQLVNAAAEAWLCSMSVFVCFVSARGSQYYCLAWMPGNPKQCFRRIQGLVMMTEMPLQECLSSTS